MRFGACALSLRIEVGQGGFLVIAGAAFGVASLAALPLQETRGGELKDFAEEAAVEAEEAEEYDSDSDDESDAEVEHAQLSWAFANGTLGILATNSPSMCM